MMEQLRGRLAACSSSLRESGLYRRCFPLSNDVEMGGRRLQLLRILGEGGYSFVYLVRDLNDPEQAHYALKRIWAVTADQLEDAKREIATISKLKHKNLLHAVDSLLIEKRDASSGACGTEVFILFPLYHDGSLMEEMDRRVVAGEPFTTWQVLDIFLQLCYGVAAMHSLTPALAHRDVKPQNVLLTHLDTPGVSETRYSVALTDFGSTRLAVQEVLNRTMALRLQSCFGHTLGGSSLHTTSQEDAEAHCTAPYRAPELFDVPSNCVIDSRVDVWSLGCVLYYMMYGVSPFEHVLGESGGSLQLAVMGCKLQWPVKPQRRYPEELRAVVVKCLETNPGVRPYLGTVVTQLEELRARLANESGSGGLERGMRMPERA